MARYRKFLLIDDHAIFREGAALHLRSLGPEVEVAHASTPAEGLRLTQATQPDLIFLDLNFNGNTDVALHFLKELKQSEELDRIPVLVMSGEMLDRSGVEALLAKGAAGFLSKGSADTADIIRAAVTSMEAGIVFIHGARPVAAAASLASRVEPRDARSLGLKPSHHRVLVRHVKGMPYKRIARELGITEATVREYVSDMCRDFKVQNSKALIYEFARAGVALEAE